MWAWMKEDIMRVIMAIKLKALQDTSSDNQDDTLPPQNIERN